MPLDVTMAPFPLTHNFAVTLITGFNAVRRRLALPEVVSAKTIYRGVLQRGASPSVLGQRALEPLLRVRRQLLLLAPAEFPIAETRRPKVCRWSRCRKPGAHLSKLHASRSPRYRVRQVAGRSDRRQQFRPTPIC